MESCHEVGEKNNAVSVPMITFEHPSMDESEAKISNNHLKSDSQEKLNNDDMRQIKNICSGGLSTAQESKSQIISVSETPMIIKKEVLQADIGTSLVQCRNYCRLVNHGGTENHSSRKIN